MDHRPALDITALRAALTGPGTWWRRLDVVDETGSTNADLLARAAAGDDIDGAVLLAEHQTAGRGRHGREWSTPPRAQLALSVGVGAAGVPPATWGWLPLAVGVAVIDALAEVSGVTAGLKWPNDVLVADGKLAGILAEVAAPEPVIVVGVGLNAAMTAAEAPTPDATSLAMLGVSGVDRTGLAEALLRQLEVRIAAWRAADPALMTDYRRYSLTLGTRVRASLPGDRTVAGRAESIDELGRLCVRTGAEAGEGLVTVSAGDITHLRPSAP